MTQVQVQVKTASKMTLAKALFAEIFTPGYKLEGKTQRAAFIERAMGELGMTKNGAATYYQNISNQVNKGMGLYTYNKPAKKKTAAPTKAEVKAIEDEAILALPHLEKQRWMVVDGQGAEVNHFATRSEAQVFAKAHGLKWADRTKVA